MINGLIIGLQSDVIVFEQWSEIEIILLFLQQSSIHIVMLNFILKPGHGLMIEPRLHLNLKIHYIEHLPHRCCKMYK